MDVWDWTSFQSSGGSRGLCVATAAVVGVCELALLKTKEKHTPCFPQEFMSTAHQQGMSDASLIVV